MNSSLSFNLWTALFEQRKSYAILFEATIDSFIFVLESLFASSHLQHDV